MSTETMPAKPSCPNCGSGCVKTSDGDVVGCGDCGWMNRGLFAPTLKRLGVKIGRNDQCPCGSGNKYKRCCIGKTEYTEA